MAKRSPTLSTYEALEVKSLRARSRAELIVDRIIAQMGSIWFLVINATFFITWIVYNGVKGKTAFDPYPFGMLTMIVSLEAIFLSILVLINQNRSIKTDTLREEVHMKVNFISESEVTKVLLLLTKVANKVGVNINDPEIREMLRALDPEKIEQDMQQQLDQIS